MTYKSSTVRRHIREQRINAILSYALFTIALGLNAALAAYVIAHA